jgi:cytidine deaminase
MSARQHQSAGMHSEASRQASATRKRASAGERERLLATARAAAQHAYAPYSRFRVGAAVVVETAAGPEVVTGANVENASYGLTLCAERAALAAACLRVPPAEPGSPLQPPRITHVAIACVDAPADAPPAGRMPCGACRQWLAELAPNAVYYVDGAPQDLRLADLLPFAFHFAE